MSKIKFGLGVILSIVIIFSVGLNFMGCIFPENPEKNQTNSNQTRIIGVGDTVTVDYILRDEHGKIIDTTLPNIGEKYGIHKKYWGPIKVKIADDNGFIKGFTYSLMGHKVGDHYNVTVPPELGYGEKDPNLIIYQDLVYNVSLYQWVPMDELLNYSKSHNFTIAENVTFPYRPSVYATIINYTDDVAWIKLNLTVNQTFIWSNLEQKVLNVTNDTATIKFMVENNSIMFLKNPKIGDNKLRRAKIIILNDTTFMIDFNPELRGKTLYFEIWVRDVE